LSSGRENSAFAAFLLIVLVVVPVYAYIDSTRIPSAQQSGVIGNLQLRSTTVEMTGLSRNGVSLNLEAVVYNPNGFGATLKAANYSVYANGHYLGEGQLAHEYDFGPQSSQTIVFPVSVGWKSAFLTTGSYLVDLGNLAWRANGTASIEVVGFPLSVSFEFATG
jgi:LEA14-like dessication related protein